MRTTADLRSAMLAFDPGWSVDLDQVRARAVGQRRRGRIVLTACATAMVVVLCGVVVALAQETRRPVLPSGDLGRLPTTPVTRTTSLPTVLATGPKATVGWNRFSGWLEAPTPGTPRICVGDGTTDPYCAPLSRSKQGWLAAERYGSGYADSTLVFAVIDDPLATVVVAAAETEVPASIVDLGSGYRLVVAPIVAEPDADTDADSRIRLWGFDSRNRLVGYTELS